MNKPTSLLLLGLATTAWSLSAAEPDLSKLPAPSDKKGLTYAKDIKPIFEASCFGCHGEQRQRGDLRLDSLEAVLKGGENGKILKHGDSKGSALVVAVAQIDEETAMPPKRRPGGRNGQGGPGGQGGGRGGFGPGNMLAPQMVTQGDKNADKKLSKTEFTGLADAWFDKMDPDKTGKLTQEQFTAKLADVLPAPQGRGPQGGGAPGAGAGGAPGGGQRPGGGRGGFNPSQFVGPGLFTAADADKDGSVTKAELKTTFGKWFTEWDADKSDALTEQKISEGLTAALPRPNFGGQGGPGGQGGFGGGPGGVGGPGGGAGRGPGGQGGGQGGPGGGEPPKPLTPEQVALVRAWIDQGAK